MGHTQNKPASSGDILQIANIASARLCKILADDPNFTTQKSDSILSKKGGRKEIHDLVDEMARKFLNIQVSIFSEKTKYLKLISDRESLMIDACDGSNTLTLDNQGPFNWVDGDFVNWSADEPGTDTLETEVGVYEMTSNANFQNLFGSFGVDLDSLCLTTSQIKTFCEKHQRWLRTDGYGTFFLFKSHNKFFVANVYWGSGRLRVLVYRLSGDSVWDASDALRIVVPATKHLGTQG